MIKIERPGSGDDTRAWGPPFLKDAEGNDTSEAAYYLSANRNKKSVTVDFTQPEGQRIVRELAAKADILLENFKVGGLKAYGLDYESLKQVNPKLIYCSITGFGQSGPYAKRAGYDFMIQGLGGLMSLTGRADNEEGAGPVKVGVALTDILTGLYSSTAVLAALAHRDVSGIGQHIDMALLDVQVACLANQTLNYLTTGVPPRRLGNAHPNIVPYQDFPTADGDMILTVGNDSQFRKFAELADHPEWADDPRFATNKARVANREVLIPLIRQATVLHTTAEWILSWSAPACPAGRSTTWRRCSPTRRCRPAACAWSYRTRWPGRCRRWPARSACPRRRWNTATRRPPSASTPMRSSRRSSAWTRPRWKGCATAR